MQMTALPQHCVLLLIPLLFAAFGICTYIPSPLLTNLTLLLLGFACGYRVHSHIHSLPFPIKPASIEHSKHKAQSSTNTLQVVRSTKSNTKPSICNITVIDRAKDPHSTNVADQRQLPINAESYHEFENECVEGKVIFLLVQETMNATIARLFQGKRRLFWIQMQLRFKTVPSGELYIGGEVPRPMTLGFFTSQLAKIILSILKSLVRGLHFSFGAIYGMHETVKYIDEEELPHICFPLYTAVDQFICTPPDMQPPPLGSIDFGETKEESTLRRKSGSLPYAYDTHCTYSFHFHSYFIDFQRWMIVNVPGMKEIPLQSFWADMPLRLVAYSINRSIPEPPNLHTRNAKQYFFCFEVRHNSNDAESNDFILEHEAKVQSENPLFQKLSKSLGLYELSVPVWFEYCSAPLEDTTILGQQRLVGYVLQLDAIAEADCETLASPLYVLVSASDAFAPVQYLNANSTESAANTSRRFSIDVSSSNSDKSRGRKKLQSPISVQSYSHSYDQIEQERMELQNQLRELVSLSNDPESSSYEQAKAVKTALIELFVSSVKRLSSAWPLLGKDAMQFNEQLQTNSVSDGHSSRIVHVIRAVSETFWRHEWMTLDAEAGIIEFCRPRASYGDTCHNILLSDVLYLGEEFDQDLYGDHYTENAPALYWLGIITIYACYHIAFIHREERNHWKQVVIFELEGNPKTGGTSLPQRMNKSIHATCDQIEPSNFTSKSHGAKRIVLNHRCHFLYHLPIRNEKFESVEQLTIDLLESVVKLNRLRQEPRSIQALLRVAIQLQSLMSAPLRDQISQHEESQNRETCKKTIFLNLFHLLRLYASLFPCLIPQKLQHWSRFFNCVSFIVDGIYFSLAEIEHCILRAPMTSIRVFIIKFVIPRKLQLFRSEKALDPATLALQIPDVRLNFAMNSLTKSCMTTISIYHSKTLNEQLSAITALAVKQLILYDEDAQIVHLPRICDWYRNDFVKDGAKSSAIISNLLPYADEQRKRIFESLLSSSRCKFKFTKFDFQFHKDILVLAQRKEHSIRLSSQWSANDLEKRQQRKSA